MDWLVVTEDYLKYLRKEEKRINRGYESLKSY